MCSVQFLQKKKRENILRKYLSKYQSRQTYQRFVDCTNILQGLREIEVKETLVKGTKSQS